LKSFILKSIDADPCKEFFSDTSQSFCKGILKKESATATQPILRGTKHFQHNSTDWNEVAILPSSPFTLDKYYETLSLQVKELINSTSSHVGKMFHISEEKIIASRSKPLNVIQAAPLFDGRRIKVGR
jgi:hypothetical protein